ncbi:mitochondrial ubiquitin ligase activator of nfkb 1-A [Mugil cephalus]|uniref:mitochondrial ubiquitin ligase activator of nfkb 1-A n=1 Tax=Mugil cephalus TaxID=48193 RepID=UPI001FB70E44|nr:mitochondrial ubiquitin ligase activator of nfkb 1-A [Mugil cephalus]
MDGFSINITEAMVVGTSLALSGICYYLYRRNQMTVDKLDNAPHFTIDGDLKNILKVTPGACLQYVVIEGAVKPVDKPLTSEFNKEIVGVLRKFMLKEHRLLWNGISRTWTDNERVVHESVNMVPFVLVGTNEAEVRVLCPLQASGTHMEVTYEEFDQAKSGFMDLVGQFISGEKLKGQLKIEEMLKVGTTLTGVGEVILDADNTLSLRPPSNGSQYFLSLVDFDTLREEKESAAVGWKVLAVTSALVGAAVLSWAGLRYYRHIQHRRKREQEARDFERLMAEASRPSAAQDAMQDGAGNHTGSTCVICLTQPRNCILLDCGHVCCCYTCYQALPQHRCPICRQNIVRVVPLYLV